MHTTDVIVIGGGIAGVSVAGELAAAGASVAVVEMEATLAHHTTGRSAAQYLINYGDHPVRLLTAASRAFFDAGDDLWSPRRFLRVGRADHEATLRADVEEGRRLAPTTEFLDGPAIRELVPVMRPDVVAALHEPDAMELDVAAIHQTYVRMVREAGGAIRTTAPVVGLRPGPPWIVELGDGSELAAEIVVNAAGAWGDHVAGLAGVAPVGLRPLRRTIAVVGLPDGVDAADWPLIGFERGDGGMDAYCKPEPGGLMVSPADETPDEPCDARPEEIDIARALDGLAAWTTLEGRHVRASWAGLRTFVADRNPVVGFDPIASGFFWAVGQGGYGIQMAPGLARAAAGLLLDAALPRDLVQSGLTADDLAPDRPGLTGELVAGH